MKLNKGLELINLSEQLLFINFRQKALMHFYFKICLYVKYCPFITPFPSVSSGNG